MLDHLRTAPAAIAGTAGVTASPAQAGDQPGDVWYQGIIRSWAQGRCPDSNGKGDVYTLPCSGSPYRRWVIWIDIHNENDWARVHIMNEMTDRYLEGYCCTCGQWQPLNLRTLPWRTDSWLMFPSDADWNAWRFASMPGVSQQCLDANEPTDTTGKRPYLSNTDYRPNPDPRLPPNYCTSNFQDWKLGF